MSAITWRPGQPKQEWGPRAWHWLHLMAINYPPDPSENDMARARVRIGRFIQSLPCADCRIHAAAYIAAVPPDASDAQSLQVWAWRFHNAVNRRLGKRQFPFAAYRQLYLSEMCWAEWSSACP